MSKKRSACLFDVTKSLIDGGQLWISALGRNIRNTTTAKHNIKKVDTLVGNEKLHRDRQGYYANNTVHKKILTTLSARIPTGCRPIIVSDAGFRNPWFQQIIALGWDFVGRLGHNTQIKNSSDTTWQGAKSLHPQATTTPKFLGYATVAKTNPMNIYIVLKKKAWQEICKICERTLANHYLIVPLTYHSKESDEDI